MTSEILTENRTNYLKIRSKMSSRERLTKCRKMLTVKKCNWNAYGIIIHVITLWTAKQILYSKNHLTSTFSQYNTQ